MSFAKESRPFVVSLSVAALVLWVFDLSQWALVTAAIAAAILLFFRIPNRHFDGEEDIVLAPANGVVTKIDSLEEKALGEGSFHRIAVFLSVFDVHVQRAPLTGEVLVSNYTAGRKLAAFRAQAEEVNENHFTVIRGTRGDLIGIRQIAGLLARRVVCYLDVGSQVERGQVMGLIKFGSRVDLLVPLSYSLEVRKGQRLREGQTIVARPRETL